MLLEVSHLTVCYDKAMLINDLSMGVDKGELVSLVGPNGAGKSTLLRAITGLVAWEKRVKKRSTGGEITLKGEVVFEGERIDQIPSHEIVKRGLIHCPERRRPFREMSVIENLMAGSYLLKDKKQIEDNLKRVYELFPILHGRSNQISGTLSGGEQQMLAIGRSLMSEPDLLILDEPSLGLSPLFVKNVLESVTRLNKAGLTILLLEQNVMHALEISHRGYVLENGKITLHGDAKDLLEDQKIQACYLGL